MPLQCTVGATHINRQQSSTHRYREFFIFLMVSEPVSEKNGTGKKSWNRYQKKVSEPVSEIPCVHNGNLDFRCQNWELKDFL